MIETGMAKRGEFLEHPLNDTLVGAYVTYEDGAEMSQNKFT